MNTQIILDLLARPATDVIRTLGLSEKIKRSWLMGNKLFYPGFMVKLNAVKVVELRFEKNFSNRFWQDLYEHA